MDLTSNQCPRCGRALSSDARFCDSCGFALGVESAPLPEETLPANGAKAAASGVTKVEEASAPVWAPAGESQPLAGETTEAAPAPALEQLAYPLRPSAPQAEVKYAGFWRRALALALDIFVLASVYTLLLVVELVPELPTEIVLGEVTPAHRVLAVMALIYFVIMEASPVQATLGKRALELAVTDLSGKRISFWRSLGRNLGKILSEIILLLGFVMAAFTTRKQALHDLIAGCVVIRRQ